MIAMGSRLEVADNSGARMVKMIGYVGGNKKNAVVGDVISICVRSATPNSKVKKGQVFRAVVIRTRQAIKRSSGLVVRFSQNSVVLLSKQGEPIGTRVFGLLAREVRNASFVKIASLAKEVI